MNTQTNLKIGISVIVCCYNSAKRLTETIRHLAFQKVSTTIPWEVIIVDNASTDGTALTAMNEWRKYNVTDVHFNIIEQPIAGLSHARDKGLTTAAYEYLVYCDDDNWLDENYVERAFGIMSTDAQIGVLGGCGSIEAEQPAILADNLLKLTTTWGPQNWATDSHWVYGAGSVYRKSILLELRSHNWQQVTTGRIGNKLLSGEDIEICLASYLLGYKIVADNELKFKHFVPLKRQSIEYILNVNYWLGYSQILLIGYFALATDDKRTINQIIKSDLQSVIFALSKCIAQLAIEKIIASTAISIQTKISYKTLCGKLKSIVLNRHLIIANYYNLKQLFARINGYAPATVSQ